MSNDFFCLSVFRNRLLLSVRKCLSGLRRRQTTPCLLFNSISSTGNTEVFANNADSGESARNELSHLKSALFAFKLPK